MNSTKKVKKNYDIAKTLIPLLHASLMKKKDLKELFEKVEESVEEIMEETKTYNDLTKREKEQISSDFFEIMSVILSNEVLINESTYLEEAKDEIITVANKIPNFLKRIRVENKEVENLIQISLTYIIKESYMFHNTLYLSDYIVVSEMNAYNLKTIKNAIKNISILINYIKKNQKENDIKLNAENFKISGYIYSIGLSALFDYLLKDEKRINDYLRNQEKYLKKIDKSFIENYGMVAKTTSIISEHILDEKD